jgi:predicted 2-oxoglutarate/Fe(II)-dependent dioxygenase YbiX/peroxiredoxin
MDAVREADGLSAYDRIGVGDPAPPFILPDRAGTQWSPLDNDIAGKPLLLLFQAGAADAFGRSVAPFVAAKDEFDRLGCSVFALTRGDAPETGPITLLTDATSESFRAYGIPASSAGVVAVLVTPNTKIAYISDGGAPDVARALAEIRRICDARSAAMLGAHPPVLIVPMALSGDDCAFLIRLWHALDERHGRSGHSEVDPACVTFLREYGRVQQYHIEDKHLLESLDAKLARRIMPEIVKAFDSQATQREGLVISRYDSGEGGMLRPHRDCASAETAHRRFTLTVALNDDFVGGELKFREYGDQIYRLPIGTAALFTCALMHEVLPVTSGSRFALVTHLW